MPKIFGREVKIRDFFRSKSFFFRFHWLKHPQKPIFGPLDRLSTTRGPFFVTILFFKNQCNLREKDLCIFRPSGTRQREKKFFFKIFFFIWDGSEWFLSHQNGKMHPLVCNQRPIWAQNGPQGAQGGPQNPPKWPKWPFLAEMGKMGHFGGFWGCFGAPVEHFGTK